MGFLTNIVNQLKKGQGVTNERLEAVIEELVAIEELLKQLLAALSQPVR